MCRTRCRCCAALRGAARRVSLGPAPFSLSARRRGAAFIDVLVAVPPLLAGGSLVLWAGAVSGGADRARHAALAQGRAGRASW
jgi:hypothetical protein